MVDPKKIIKGVKAVKKATKKKKITPKQKTYEIRGAAAKRERELEAEGGRPSRARIAELRKIAFPEQYK